MATAGRWHVGIRGDSQGQSTSGSWSFCFKTLHLTELNKIKSLLKTFHWKEIISAGKGGVFTRQNTSPARQYEERGAQNGNTVTSRQRSQVTGQREQAAVRVWEGRSWPRCLPPGPEGLPALTLLWSEGWARPGWGLTGTLGFSPGERTSDRKGWGHLLKNRSLGPKVTQPSSPFLF